MTRSHERKNDTAVLTTTVDRYCPQGKYVHWRKWRNNQENPQKVSGKRRKNEGKSILAFGKDLHLILAKRPRSDTEASLPREGAPGFPSFEYGGQYAVPESRSLKPTVGGRYEHVAHIEALVLQHKCHKTSSKVPNTSPALIVI